MAITKLLVEKGWDVFLINRGSRTSELPAEVNVINLDINDEDRVKEAI
ncbi:MAG: hypothetical protein MJ153_04235 [Clostridia bacterium]|nr:hypothetical protein [Clostridia bacterium]